MEWTVTKVNLRQDPRLFDLADCLKITHDSAICRWVLLRAWVGLIAEWGDLSGLKLPRIAEGAGWTGDPESFMKALISCGLVDVSGKLAEWESEHGHMLRERDRKRSVRNGTLPARDAAREVKKDPARDPARGLPRDPSDDAAREVARIRTDYRTDGLSDGPTTPPSPPRGADPVDQLFDRFEELAGKWHLPRPSKRTPGRRAKARSRIAEGILESWSEIEAAVAALPWTRGEGDRAWRLDFDYLVKSEDAWRKLIERGEAAARSPAAAIPLDRRQAVLDAATRDAIAKVYPGEPPPVPPLELSA